MKRAPTSYNVRPRYGPGSPGMVSQRIAESVAASLNMSEQGRAF